MMHARTEGMEVISRVFVPGLESLVWPHDRSSFLRDYWQRRPLHIEGSQERLPVLARTFFDFDVERILGAADLGRTIVQPPLEEQRRRTPRDPLPAPAPEVKTLMLLYALGSQLYVATSGVPGVEEWIERVSRDLGRIWPAGRGDIYATRKGGGADIHFDGNDNFTIQLQGHKVWFFSSEPYCEQPLHNSGELEGVPYDPTYAFDPARIDATRLEEVVLGPGDMFYMPRGFLHGTRAGEDSLSFNLSLGAQPWADVLLEGLRAYLICDPRMREGATRDAGAARARVDRLKQLVAGLCGDDLLAAPQDPVLRPQRGKRVARRNPLSWWSSSAAGEADIVVVEIRTPDRSATAFEVSRELVALLRAIPGGPELFAADDLVRSWARDQDDVEAGREFVDHLVDSGLLGWVDADDGQTPGLSEGGEGRRRPRAPCRS
jgi:ribosomal protein L16 Arg81 hydroxylase